MLLSIESKSFHLWNQNLVEPCREFRDGKPLHPCLAVLPPGHADNSHHKVVCTYFSPEQTLKLQFGASLIFTASHIGISFSHGPPVLFWVFFS